MLQHQITIHPKVFKSYYTGEEDCHDPGEFYDWAVLQSNQITKLLSSTMISTNFSNQALNKATKSPSSFFIFFFHFISTGWIYFPLTILHQWGIYKHIAPQMLHTHKTTVDSNLHTLTPHTSKTTFTDTAIYRRALFVWGQETQPLAMNTTIRCALATLSSTWTKDQSVNHEILFPHIERSRTSHIRRIRTLHTLHSGAELQERVWT